MSFKNLSLGNYTVTVSTDRMYQKASELETLVEKLDSALTLSLIHISEPTRP